MIKTFTKNDLIRYLYKETTEAEEKEINRALLCDAQLRSVYADLCSLNKALNEAQLEPSHQTVVNILNYANNGVPEKQK